MKLYFFLFVLLLVQFSEQFAKYENCPPEFPLNDPQKNLCVKVTCHPDGSKSAVTCPLALVLCPPEANPVDIPEDNSKVYPECCPQTYCE